MLMSMSTWCVLHFAFGCSDAGSHLNEVRRIVQTDSMMFTVKRSGYMVMVVSICFFQYIVFLKYNPAKIFSILTVKRPKWFDVINCEFAISTSSGEKLRRRPS